MALYPVTVGDLIAGKYLVERFIGEGGMGLVVLAKHVELEQHVAIKFLLPQIAEHVTAAQRFRREARAAARIRGEHACRVLDVATLDNGVPYMVMEYLDGCDLSTELLRRGRLPPEEAVDYLLQACEALAEAHSGGIIHRDLKPGNFFLAGRADGTRCLKVLDFGVSKLMADTDSAPLGLTSTATMIGSPLYMSPEQLESAKDVDARTDIWGLGVVLYELVTGRTPFLADSLAQLTHQVLSVTPPSCATLGVHVPEGLEAVMMRSLSKRRTDRYASVAELARALVPYGPAHGAVSAARVARLSPSLVSRPAPAMATRLSFEREPSEGGFAPTRGSASGTPASWERDSAPAPANRRNLGLGAIAAVAALTLGALAWKFGAGSNGNGTESSVMPATPAAAPSAPVVADVAPPDAPAPIRPKLEPQPQPSSATGMEASVPTISPTPDAGRPAEPVTAQPVPTPTPARPAAQMPPRAAVTRPVATPEPPRLVSPRAPRTPEPAPPDAPEPAPPPTESPRGSRVSDFGGRR